MKKRDTHNLIVMAAIRYSLGRRSYMPSTVSEYIKEIWNDTSEKHRAFYIKQLDQAIDDIEYTKGIEGLGDECDAKTWFNLLEWMIQHEAE